MCPAINDVTQPRPAPGYGSRKLQPLFLMKPGVNVTSEEFQSVGCPELVNKHIFQKIEEWFESWQPWQQRVILCGLTDRCSVSQLETLQSTLDPIYHRESVAALKQQYHNSSFFYRRKSKKKKIKRAKFKDNEVDTADQNEMIDYDNITFMPEIAAEDMELLNNIINDGSTEVGHKNPDDLSACTMNKIARHYAGRIIVSALRQCQKVSEVDERTDVQGGSEPLSENYSKSVSDDNKLRESFVNDNNIEPILENDSVIPTLSLDDLLKSNDQCPEKQLLAPWPELPKLSHPGIAPISLQQKHHHRQPQGSSGSKADFFEKAQLVKLGQMQREIRTGPVHRPSALLNVMVPIQKCYKPAKWFGRTPCAGKKFEKAKKTQLRKHFQMQIEQIWDWMMTWQNYEKLSLLVHMVKLTSTELLKYCAQCVRQRLSDRTDINRLQDSLLLEIFSYLQAEDLDNTVHVCKRWKYLCNRDELWMLKCQILGEKEGILDLDELVEKLGDDTDHSIDWRLAYWELQRLVEESRQTLPKPKHLLIDGKTPDGKIRIGGRFMSPKKDGRGDSKEPSDYFNSRSPSQVYQPWRSRDITMISKNESEDEQEDDDISSTMDEYSILKSDAGSDSIKGSRRYHRRQRRSNASFGNSARSLSIRDKLNKLKKTDDTVQESPSREDKPLLRRNRHDEEETALDIRPELRQARDLLGKSLPGHFLAWKKGTIDPKACQAQYAGDVKAVHRVRRLQGHMDVVLCIRCDKSRLISGSMDRSVRIWDIRTGRSIHKLYGHMMWDLLKFNRRMVFHGHSGAISCLKFNPTFLVTGSHDKTVRVWSLRSYGCVNVIKGHRDAITCLEFNDEQVLTGSSDKTLRLSDIKTGECLKIFTGSPLPILAMAVMKDLILTSNSEGQVYFWNKLSGEVEAAVECHKSAVNTVSFSNHRFFTGSADSTVKEWDLNTLTCVRYLHGHKAGVKDIQVTGRYIVSCSEDGSIRIWDTDAPALYPADKTQDDTIPTTIVDKQKGTVHAHRSQPTALSMANSQN